MAAPKIRADHESLRSIANIFTQQASECRNMVANLRSRMGTLRGGDWIGEGASKFYAEMDSAVLPSLGRLVSALNEAASVTTKISQVMQQAEDDAARMFGGGLSGAGGFAGIGAQVGAAVGAAFSSAAVGGGAGVGAAVGAAIAKSVLGAAIGGVGPAALGAMAGSAVAASNVFQGAGVEAGRAIGAAVQNLLGQGAASATGIGAAVGGALASSGLLPGLAAGGQAAGNAAMPVIGTLTGVIGAVTGKVDFSSLHDVDRGSRILQNGIQNGYVNGKVDFSSLNIADIAVTPMPGGPIPIPYPSLQMGFGIGQGLGNALNGGNLAEFGSSFMQSVGFSAEGTPKFVNDMRGAFESAGASSGAAAGAQQAQAQISKAFDVMSSVAKTFHDTQMNIIRNIGA